MLKDLLTLEFKFSESHLVFPNIILTLLVFLGALIVITNLIKRAKEGNLTKFNFKFFVKNYDKLKFYGTLVLLVAYVPLLDFFGFLVATILFMFLITALFMGDMKPRTLIISGINSLSTSLIIWFVFGQVFNITLP